MSCILHLKNYNPSDGQQGLSSLSAASKAINLYAKIMDWNKSLLKNAIRPSGALIFQDGNGYLTEEQFERLQQQFYDNFSGASNSGKPLIFNTSDSFTVASTCNNEENSFLISVTKLSNGRNNKRYYARNDQCK
jgi:phage portal protein BeeE